MTSRSLRFIPAVFLMVCVCSATQAQIPRRTPPRPAPSPTVKGPQLPNRPKPSPTPSAPMKKASELISRQPPITTNNAVLAKINPENARVIVSIGKQRAYLMTGDEIGIDSPI